MSNAVTTQPFSVASTSLGFGVSTSTAFSSWHVTSNNEYSSAQAISPQLLAVRPGYNSEAVGCYYLEPSQWHMQRWQWRQLPNHNLVSLLRDEMTCIRVYLNMNLFTACWVVQAVVKATSQSYGNGKISTPSMWPRNRYWWNMERFGIHICVMGMTTHGNTCGAATMWVV